MHSCDSQTSLRQNPARVPAFLLHGLPGIVVAFCLVLAGCNDTPHKAETDEPLTVAAVKPERRNVPLLVESTGMTQAVRTADIVARVEGIAGTGLSGVSHYRLRGNLCCAGAEHRSGR